MADGTIGVGLIGFGMAGDLFHAPSIAAVHGLKLTAIFARSGSGAAAQAAYPEVPVVRTVGELLANPAVELVVVATPTHSHFEMARQVLLAGRHVVVDKPFTPTSKEARELIDLAQAQRRKLAVYQNRRWDSECLTGRKVLQSGVLGELLEYESHYDRYRPVLRTTWQDQSLPGCGVIYDLGSHVIDTALTLLGLPVAVTAELWGQREGTINPDAFDIRLHYPTVRARLKVSLLNAENGPRLVLHGRRGSYVKTALDVQEEALKRHERPGGSGWGEEPRESWGILHTVGEDGQTQRQPFKSEPGNYAAYYENVRDALLGKAELAVPGEAGFNVIRTIELAKESSRLRRTVDWTND